MDLLIETDKLSNFINKLYFWRNIYMDKKPYLNLVITVLILLLLSFAITMINQAVQLINTATMLHPYFGRGLLIFFVILGSAAVIILAVILSKFEKPLQIPIDETSEEYKQYIYKLKDRLMKNKYLKKSQYIWDNNKSEIEAVNDALLKIDDESQKIIKSSAAGIFTTTAVSQNGALDGIFVFVASLKLVWSISSLYNQRPAIRDLIKLYTNVFGTVLATRQIDDLDIVAEQFSQILPTLMTGSVGKMVPVVSFVTSFVMDSILEGTLNTLLVLRIGLLTQYYSRSTTKIEPKKLGRTATVQAGKMLGEIISKDLMTIVKVWSKASIKAIAGIPKSTTEALWGLINSKIKGSYEEAAITDN